MTVSEVEDLFKSGEYEKAQVLHVTQSGAENPAWINVSFQLDCVQPPPLPLLPPLDTSDSWRKHRMKSSKPKLGFPFRKLWWAIIPIYVVIMWVRFSHNLREREIATKHAAASEVSGHTTHSLDRLPAKNDPPSDILNRFGKPDIDDSTEYDQPRPPMVTRWLVYQRSDVCVLYLANAKIGTPPPYNGWLLTGFTDAESKTAISAAEAIRRLKSAR